MFPHHGFRNYCWRLLADVVASSQTWWLISCSAILTRLLTFSLLYVWWTVFLWLSLSDDDHFSQWIELKRVRSFLFPELLSVSVRLIFKKHYDFKPFHRKNSAENILLPPLQTIKLAKYSYCFCYNIML